MAHQPKNAPKPVWQRYIIKLTTQNNETNLAAINNTKKNDQEHSSLTYFVR